MDNIYRRDHEMAYISDDAVVAQQKETKKAVREYNEAMPFDPEKGMEYLERTGLKHKKLVRIHWGKSFPASFFGL